ncbi:MAG: Fmu (Sun) domain-containing protein [Ferruginibacter sp.]
MSHHHSHLSSAVKVIQTQQQGEPLVHHLKRFFAADKKFGSKDRKHIASLCYNYYRLGKALKNTPVEERIVIAAFVCNGENSPFLAAVNPSFNEKIELSLTDKLAFVGIDTFDIFPFMDELGIEVHREKFALSFLSQPLFFLRIRPGKEAMVVEKLAQNKIEFEEITTSCLALQQGFKTEQFFEINKEVVVQDRNSQKVFKYLQQPDVFLKKDISVWDCCAASGGKSILLHDVLHGHVQLHVSDVRAGILSNLRVRFKEAGIKKYDAFTVDLLQENVVDINNKFDLIICDVPCSGSGTWARTPEQLVFFTAQKIVEYAVMQYKIAAEALKHLDKSGLFFYITCSVFKNENEEVVDYLQKKFCLQILQMEYLKGYETKADTMFVAVLSF